MKKLWAILRIGTMLGVLASPALLLAQTGVPVKITAVGNTFAHTPNPDPALLRLSAVFLPNLPAAGNGLYNDEIGYAGNDVHYLSLSLKTVQMEPGKTYNLSLETEWMGDVTVTLIAPAGYLMEVNGKRQGLYSISGLSRYGGDTLYVRVVAPSDVLSAPVRAGAGSSIAPDRIYWEVGLGSLQNGDSAGQLTMSDPGAGSNWSTVLNPTLLGYESPSDEIKIFRASGQLRQIVTPQADVDIVTHTEDPTNLTTSQFEIRFYYPDPSQGTSSLHTFSGKQPYVAYRVEPGSTATSMKMTRFTRTHTSPTSSSAARTAVATLARSGSSWPAWTWTRRDWYTDGTTPLTESVATSSSGSGGTRNHSTVLQGYNGGALAQRIDQVYTPLSGWGEILTSETLGTSTGLTSTSDYYTSSGTSATFGYLKSVAEPGGGWTAYEYYTASSSQYGTIKYRYRPFGNSPSSVSMDPAQGEVTYFEYSADPFGRYTRPSLIQTKVNNTDTGKSVVTYGNVSATINAAQVVESTRLDYNDSTHSLTTVTRFYREDETNLFLRNRVHAITRPGGVKVAYAYQRGSLSGTTFTKSGSAGLGAGSASRVAVITGTTGSGYTTYDGYDIDDLSLVNAKSTLQVTLRDARALIVRTETHVWSSSTWNLVEATDFAYDYAGQLTSRTASNGGTYTAHYAGEQKSDETDDTGVKIAYVYDVAGRVYTATKEGGSTTTLGYDAAGQVTSTTVSGSSGSETIVNATHYDNAGRPDSVAPAGLSATTIAYNATNRTRTTTAPAPDSGTTVETWQRDGRLAAVTGSAVVSQTYTYAMDSGRLRTQVDSGSASRWQKSWQDWLGRTVKTERPGWYTQPTYVENTAYDGTTGRLTKVDRRDGSGNRVLDDILFEYDALGQLSRQGLDVGNGGSLVLASMDRIADTDRYFEYYSGAWWLHEEAKSYPTSNNASAHLDSLARTRLTGFGGNRAEVQLTTTNGALITRTVAVNFSTKTVTTTTRQDGISNRSETVVNGLATGVTGSDGLSYTTGYDALGRPNTSVDPRTGATTTTYYSGTPRPATVADADGLLVGYGYDAAGRKVWEKNADNKYARYDYTARHQLYRQWGDLGTPVEHSYDSTYGDHLTQKTYRGGSSWNGTNWPGSAGTADTTTWTYDPATGLLNAKTDALSHAVSYSYNPRGQTAQRIAARGPSATVTATYGYDGATGENTSVSYSDGTPTVGALYNRKGNVYQIDDATGSRTFDLCACGRVNEEHFSSFYGSRVLTYLYETSGGLVGRYRGFQLGAGSGSNSDLEQAYAFTSGGRFGTLATKRTGNAVTRTFQYGYLANSPLVETLGITGGHAFNVTRAYDAHRDLVTSLDSRWSSASQTRFDYTYTTIMQRQTAKQSGLAFADYYPSSGYASVYNVYAYNDRGELQTAALYRGGTPSAAPAASDELPGRRFEYRYDPAGNRQTSGDTGQASLGDDEYTANAANQYSARENNTVRFTGTAGGGAAVAVPGISAVNKRDRAWSATINRPAGDAARQATVTVYAALPGQGSGGNDIVQSEARDYFVPRQNQSFGYDYAGNLTSDSVWDYTYDAENRLVAMQTRSEVIGSGMLTTADARRLEFTYDYLGRRVAKVVKKWSGSSYGTIEASRKYLYDGWNLVAEFDAISALTLVRSYTWGLDLAGSRTASGGVGALLQVRDHAKSRTWLPTYDGNGNVVALLDAEAGGSASLAAVFEYGPFGEPLRAQINDADAKEVPFRFSTKFTDTETGLVYYGLRYYSPTLGRFINKDPIEEKGGINLYAFVGNNGVNRTDFLGQFAVSAFNPFYYRPLLSDGSVKDEPPIELPPFRVSGRESLGLFNVSYAPGTITLTVPMFRIPTDAGGGSDKLLGEKWKAFSDCVDAANSSFDAALQGSSQNFDQMRTGAGGFYVGHGMDRVGRFGEEAMTGVVIGSGGIVAGAVVGEAILTSFAANYIVMTTSEVAMIETSASVVTSSAFGATIEQLQGGYPSGFSTYSGVAASIADEKIHKLNPVGYFAAVAIPAIEGEVFVNSDFEQYAGEMDHLANQQKQYMKQLQKKHETAQKECQKFLK